MQAAETLRSPQLVPQFSSSDDDERAAVCDVREYGFQVHEHDAILPRMTSNLRIFSQICS